ncbi:M23 family metallopeptidase [Rhizobium sp. Leaf383]|uniref:M23 family metallopeptidase n=1 Tax=Rhizobium sp. Leaf383 TaxID=1736357 RepID=UPI0007157755|nr:M23 family metallopeptidase [Rhizobium sp. Leaf383]KQS75964.1 hypothetical protein ASG58_14150 [Rhizobium sp. Leaf383]
MIRDRLLLVSCLALLCLGQLVSRTHAIDITDLQRSPSSFSYYALGHLVPTNGGSGPNSAARHVFNPNIRLPMLIDPAKGEHMYCNSQIFGYGGNGWGQIKAPRGSGSNDPRNYQFPDMTNICEIRGEKTAPSVCPTKTIHQGQDCRPPTPVDQKYAGVAVEDGTSYFQGGQSNVVVLTGKSKIIWNYLHMRDIAPDGAKASGQKLGMVSNYLTGGTSIHLHLEAKIVSGRSYKHVDPLPSLIVAYQKALGNSYAIDDQGDLAFDPRYEIKEGATSVDDPTPSRSSCAGENEASIGTEALYAFSSLWCHNGSVVGLVKNGTRRDFIYFKPRRDLAVLVRDDPVLFTGQTDNMSYTGKASHYGARCGNQQFEVSGPVASSFQHVSVSGRRKVFSAGVAPDGTPECRYVHADQRLEFTYIGEYAETPAPPLENAPVEIPFPSETCKGVVLADTPSSVSGMVFDNYWFHNCSIVGLVKAADGGRRMFFVRPRTDLATAAAREAAVFRGRVFGDRYEGETIQFSKACGDFYYDVSGPVDPDRRGIRLSGARPVFASSGGTCKKLEPEPSCLRFTYAGETMKDALSRPLSGEKCPPEANGRPMANDDSTLDLSADCVPKSVCSNNFPALTPRAEPGEYAVKGFGYITAWPGYKVSETFRDKNGFVIPGFISRVAGSGIWWYWMRERAGYAADGRPTFRALARAYAGIANDQDPAVVNYANAYRIHSRLYFGRQIGIDEAIDLSDPVSRWDLAQTMFHHEAGRRVAEVSQTIFEQGLRLAEERMRKN